LLRGYSTLPFYAHLFEEAGLPVADGSGLDALARVLVISGDEVTLRGRLAELLPNGMAELMVHTLPLTNEANELQQLLQLLAAIA